MFKTAIPGESLAAALVVFKLMGAWGRGHRHAGHGMEASMGVQLRCALLYSVPTDNCAQKWRECRVDCVQCREANMVWAAEDRGASTHGAQGPQEG